MGADQTVTVTIRLSNLATLNWLTTGQQQRNQTTWVDGSLLDVSYTKADGTSISQEGDLEQAGIGKCALRFTAVPGAVDKLVLYGGIVPFDKASLETKLQEVGATLSSPNCPTVALKLLVHQGKTWNGRPTDLLPTEQPGDKVGFGHLPLLESIGAGDAVFPDSNDLEKQLTTFLRACSTTNNVAVGRIADLYSKPETFSATLRAPSSGVDWPEYRGPVTNVSASTETPTG